MGLFGKSNERSPKDMVNEWTHRIRKEGYQLDRQINSIHREEEKSKRMLKDLAKKGEKDACRSLAKEIVHAKKAVNRLNASKAHLNSVQLSMKQQLANLRIAGALEKSAQVMQSMQRLVRVPEIMATMREMSKEMTKAGILEEMVEDTMDVMDDDAELDDAADAEVDKVLYELTAGELGNAPDAVSDSLPAESLGATAGPSYADPEEEEDMTAMQARLEALRS